MTDTNALADWQKNANLPNPPTEFTIAFRQAVNGEGPLLYQWRDKPHRLVFELCSYIEERAPAEHPSAEDYRNRAERAEAECRELREALERIAAGRCGDANQFASNVASAALGEQP